MSTLMFGVLCGCGGAAFGYLCPKVISAWIARAKAKADDLKAKL